MTALSNFGIIASMFRPSTLSPFVFFSPALSQHDVIGSPLAINGMKLLSYAEKNGGIPLTQSLSVFQRKCVEWAAHEFHWPGFEPGTLYSVNKVLNEPDFPPLSILHWSLQDLRLIRHYNGRALLTKHGRSILGNHVELQAALAEWTLAAPLQESLSPEAAALFWDLRHMLGIVSTRLGDWVTLGDLTDWALPVELFPARGPLGPRHDAGLFLAHNLVRPLTWLGVLENSPQNVPALSMMDRQFRKTILFDTFFRIGLPIGVEAVSVH